VVCRIFLVCFEVEERLFFLDFGNLSLVGQLFCDVVRILVLLFYQFTSVGRIVDFEALKVYYLSGFHGKGLAQLLKESNIRMLD
jgi:hypothetical protein